MNSEQSKAKRVCPWWLGYLLASPLRAWIQSPATILAPHVRSGMTVLEPGPGMGFFTLELARLVGTKGRIVAPELQPQMLTTLARRAKKRGLGERIELRAAAESRLGIDDLASAVDFVLAFAVVHELPNAAMFFQECFAALRPGGQLLLAEPRGHVSRPDWDLTLHAAAQSGLHKIEDITIPRSHAALFAKPTRSGDS